MKYLAFVLMLSCLVGSAYAQPVCSVHDGDTFTLCDGQKIRLWGIDAPELTQPLGESARDFLASVIEGRELNLYCVGKSYGRMVCIGFLDGHDVAGVVVSQGLAFDSPKYSFGKYAEQEIPPRQEALGVWLLPDGGVRPWAFRH